LLLDFELEALFEARQIQVGGIAAGQVAAAVPHPMVLRDWSHPELIGEAGVA
jgi:hypothetical protein